MTTQRKALELARPAVAEMIEAAGSRLRFRDQQRHPELVAALANLRSALAAIDAALAQPDPQPVAWMTPGGDASRSKAWCDERCRPDGPQPIPLYAAPVAQAQQDDDSCQHVQMKRWGTVKVQYTPAREISEQQLIDMTDRELLELAAKAAGLEIDRSEFNGGGSGNTGFDCLGNAVLDWHNDTIWNPLTDDGDALRLAVKLGLHIMQSLGSLGCCTVQRDAERVGSEWFTEQHGTDPYASTRRAIVRAAAEIGKAVLAAAGGK